LRYLLSDINYFACEECSFLRPDTLENELPSISEIDEATSAVHVIVFEVALEDDHVFTPNNFTSALFTVIVGVAEVLPWKF